MKNNKLFITIVIVLLLIIISILVYMNIEKENSSEKNDGYEEQEEYNNWFTNLNIELMEKFNEKYPEDYKFDLDDNNKKEYTLEQLEDEGFDLSNFNTDKIQCNMQNSKIEITIDEETNEYERTSILDCTNNEEIAQ